MSIEINEVPIDLTMRLSRDGFAYFPLFADENWDSDLSTTSSPPVSPIGRLHQLTDLDEKMQALDLAGGSFGSCTQDAQQNLSRKIFSDISDFSLFFDDFDHFCPSITFF